MKKELYFYNILFLCLAVPLLSPVSSFAQIPTDGLILHLPLNGNTSDSSGNDNNGQPFGSLIPIPDRLGNKPGAYSFDGVNDYIDVGKPVVSDFPISISAWVKGEEVWISTNGKPDVYRGVILAYTPTDVILRTGSGESFSPTGRKDYNSQYNFDSEQWNHIVGVINSFDERKIYINGNEVIGSYDNDSKANSVSFSGGTVQINQGPGERFYKGSVDEIRIFTRTISAEEVNPLYSEGGTIPETPTDLQANSVSNTEIRLSWKDNSFNENGFILQRSVGSNNNFQGLSTLPAGTTTYRDTTVVSNTQYFYQILAFNTLNGDSPYSNTASDATFMEIDLDRGLIAYYPLNGDAEDASGNGNNGTAKGTIATDDRQGNKEGALLFNGNTNIQVPDNESLDFTNAYSIALWCNTSTLTPNYQTLVTKGGEPGESYAIFIQNDGRIHIVQRINNSRIFWNSESTIQADTWHQIIVTYDGSFATVYIDGELAGTNQLEGTLSPNNAILEFGERVGGTDFFGVLDDIRLYNRALTEAEVTVLYDGGGFAQLDAGLTNLNFDNFSIIDEGDTTITAVLKNFGESTLQNAIINWKVNQVQQSSVNWNGALELQDTISVALGNYQFKQGNAYHIEAWVSNPNGQLDLNPSNDTTRLESILINPIDPHYALEFTANNQNVIVSDDDALRPEKLTVEAWVHPNSFVTWSTVIMKSSNNSWNDGYGLAHYVGTNDINFFINQYSGVKVSGDIPFNKWSHVAGTYDGFYLRLYINAKLVDSLSYSGLINHSQSPLQIGTGAGSINYQWKGFIDEVRIWNVARTKEQIETWMIKNAGISNQSGLVAAWHFGESQGKKVWDLSANHSGELFNDVKWIESDAPIGDNRVPIDAGVVEVKVESTTPVQQIDIYAVLHNFGIQQLKSANIQWFIAGQPPQNYSWSGNLLTGERQRVKLGSYTFSENSNDPVSITAFTQHPNNKADIIPQNDISTLRDIFPAFSGAFTVGGTNPDFSTLQGAIDTLAARGITNEIILNIRPGEYYQQIVIPKIPGSSCKKRLIIQSETQNENDVFIYYRVDGNNNYVISINATEGIALRHLSLEENHGSNNRVIVISDSASCIEITNCKISGNSNLITCRDGTHINRSLIYAQQNIPINGLNIHNNSFINGSDGIYLKAPVSNLIISNNKFTNQSCNEIWLEGAKDVQIQSNYIYSGKALRGIALNSTNNSILSNNFVAVPDANSNGSQPYGAGLRLNQSTNSRLFHNTVKMLPSTIGNGSALLVQGENSLQLFNNNLTNLGTGFVLETVDNPPSFSSDYNNYFTSGETIAFINQDSTTLQEWRQINGQDIHSISENPLFASDSSYQVRQEALNGSGIPLSDINQDIEGEARDNTNPDIGVDEFNLFAADLGVTAILSPQTECEINLEDSVIIEITNFGSEPQSNFPVFFQLDGLEPVRQLFTDELPAGSKQTFTFFILPDLSQYKLYNLIAYTGLETEQYVSNDTAYSTFQNFSNPSPPTNLTISDQNDLVNLPITLSWEPSENHENYDLYVWPSQQTQPLTKDLVAENLQRIRYTLCSSSNNCLLSYGQEYKWQVIAKNRCSEQAPSEVQTFRIRDLPDLTIDSTSVQFRDGTIYSDTPLTVSFDLLNLGAGSNLSEKIVVNAYLSKSREINDLSEKVVGKSYEITLDSGQKENQELSFIIPRKFFGPYFIILTVDRPSRILETDDFIPDEYNNIVIAPKVLQVTIAPFANIQIQEITQPFNAIKRTGDELTIEYIRINASEDGTAELSAFTDRIFLSQDEVLDNGDDMLDQVTTGSKLLGPGETEVISHTVTLPKYQFVDTSEYYIFVEADVTNKIFEHNKEDDNVSPPSQPLTILLRPPPNLTVSISSEDTASSRQPYLVTWTTTNDGFVDSTQTEWIDIVYISEAPEFNKNTATPLKSFPHIGVLDTSYIRSESIVLPGHLAGKQYIFVATDATDQVFELGKEDDNIAKDSVIVLLPDLALNPDSLQIIGSLLAGQSITLSAQLINPGPGILHSGATQIKVQLYQQAGNAAGSLLAENITSLKLPYLALDSLMQVEQKLLIPDTLTGSYFVSLTINPSQQLLEADYTNNEVIDQPITLPPLVLPDLEFRQVNLIADTVIAGEELEVTVEILNAGDTTASKTSWVDRIDIVRDTISLSSVLRQPLPPVRRTQAVSKDSSYTFSSTVTMPRNMFEGKYYISAYTNDSQSLLEKTNDNNTGWAKIYVKPYPTVDLAVTSFTISAENISSGQWLNFTYTTVNQSSVTTFANGWIDGIYLSDNEIFEEGRDRLIGTVERRRPLSAGDSTSIPDRVRIPDGISGNPYILIVIDINRANRENNRENNVFVNQTEIDGELVPIPLPIDLTPPPDLILNNFGAPSTLTAGQPASFWWEVINLGIGPTPLTWIDKIVLSADLTVSQDDILLKNRWNKSSLDAEGNYQDTVEVDIPKWANGNYFLLFFTDATRRIYESENEQNNLAYTSVFVRQAPPADLTVASVNIPEVVVGGSEVTINWNELNIGENAAEGRRAASILISTDTLPDNSDRKLWEASQHIFLAPSESQENTTIVPITSVPEGAYYFIVETNIGGSINELSLNNNYGYSSLIQISIPELPLDSNVVANVTVDIPTYYRIEISQDLEGESLSVTLTGTADNSYELYLSHEATPSRGKSDFLPVTLFDQNQEVIVPELKAGTYYLAAFSADANNSDPQVSLRAEVLPFEVRSVDTNHGGNAGNVTVLIEGSQFRRDMKIWLDSTDLSPLYASKTQFISPTEIYATFNLSGKELGLYDLIVERDAETSDTLYQSFEVEYPITGAVNNSSPTGGGGGSGNDSFSCLIEGLEELSPSLEIEFDIPEVLRFNTYFVMTVRYKNVGNMDIEIPKGVLVSLSGATVGFDQSALTDPDNVELELSFGEGDAPLRILRPGASGKVIILSTSLETFIRSDILRYRFYAVN